MCHAPEVEVAGGHGFQVSFQQLLEGVFWISVAMLGKFSLLICDCSKEIQDLV